MIPSVSRSGSPRRSRRPTALTTTGFLGRRDSYEVPLALHEQGLLDTHLGEWRPKSQRRVPTTWLSASALAIERRHSVKFKNWAEPYCGSDALLGRMIARRSTRLGTRAFVYSYHWPGYLAGGGDPSNATLFMVHPNPGLIRSVLATTRSLDAEFGQLSLEPEERWSADLTTRIDRAFSEATSIVCTSQFVAQGVKSLGARGTPIIIPYGVNQHPRAARRPSAPLTLLWVGQPTYRKGFFHLVKAIRPLGHAAELRCVVRASSHIEGIKLPLNVDLRLDVNDESLTDHFAAADVFIMPSLAEGFGLALLEAMGHGVPVITTDRTGVADFVRTNGCGFLVTPGDVDGITEAVVKLIETPAQLMEMSHLAHTASQPYTWDRFRAEIRSHV